MSEMQSSGNSEQQAALSNGNSHGNHNGFDVALEIRGGFSVAAHGALGLDTPPFGALGLNEVGSQFNGAEGKGAGDVGHKNQGQHTANAQHVEHHAQVDPGHGRLQ